MQYTTHRVDNPLRIIHHIFLNSGHIATIVMFRCRGFVVEDATVKFKAPVKELFAITGT